MEYSVYIILYENHLNWYHNFKRSTNVHITLLLKCFTVYNQINVSKVMQILYHISFSGKIWILYAFFFQNQKCFTSNIRAIYLECFGCFWMFYFRFITSNKFAFYNIAIVFGNNHKTIVYPINRNTSHCCEIWASFGYSYIHTSEIWDWKGKCRK